MRYKHGPSQTPYSGNFLLYNTEGSSDGHVQPVAVVHLVEFFFRFEVTQLGIGQHGSHGFHKKTMFRKALMHHD